MATFIFILIIVISHTPHSLYKTSFALLQLIHLSIFTYHIVYIKQRTKELEYIKELTFTYYIVYIKPVGIVFSTVDVT